MPIKNTTTFTRPDTSFPFWTFSDTVQSHVDSTYVVPGKLTPGLTQLSVDTLTRTRVVTWLDQAAQDAYLDDPVIRAAYKEREQYCRDHGHTKTHINQEL
jgi:hypothetical protein